jgi:hypothetical protein
MFSPRHDFHRAIHNARKATRRQDFAAAHKWMQLAEHHVRLYERVLSAEKRHREIHGYVHPMSRKTEPPMRDPW